MNQENEINFRAFFESAPGSYLVLSPDLITLAVSDAYLNATMTKRDDIVGKSVSKIFPDNPDNSNSEWIKNLTASLQFVLQNKTKHKMALQKYTIHMPDGTVSKKSWSPQNEPVFNTKNELTSIIHNITDISDLVRLQKEKTERENIALERNLMSLKMKEELEIKVEERTKELENINKDIADYKCALDEAQLVAVIDQAGTILHVNDNFCKISKYSKAELIGQNSIILSPCHPREFMTDLVKSITSGNIWKGELKNKTKCGTVYWINTTIVPFLNEDRIPFKYLLISSDITPLKFSLEKLESEKEKYRNLFENSVVSMFTTDMSTFKTITVNDMTVRMFGYKSKEEFLANFQASSHIVNPVDNGKILKVLIEKGEIRNSLHEAKRLDGTRFWIRVFIKYDPENNITQTILRDVSGQMRADQELKASEEKFRNLFENSLIGMLIADMRTLRNIEVNDVACQLYGYESHQHLLDNFRIANHFVHPSELEKNLNTLKEKGEIVDSVHELKKLDGTQFWGRIFIKLNSQKTLAQILLVDITDRVLQQEKLETKVKERTIELTASLAREREMNEMKSRFVSMASHEFRTPLSSILSSAELIRMYATLEDQEKRLKHVNRITSSIKDLSNILSDFLSLAQLEKGVIVIEKNKFNLTEFIEDLIEEMDGMLLSKGLVIKYEHEGDTIIEQSKKTLRNVMLNLMSNAIKYSPKAKDILIFSSIHNKMVTITVKDYGIGIPKEEQKYLFTEFFRAKNVENIQGTGLGLIIAKKYIELLGGKITFCSEPNEGTTFTIEFPEKYRISPIVKFSNNLTMN